MATPPLITTKKVLIIVDWTHITSEVSRLFEDVKQLFEGYATEQQNGSSTLPHKIEIQEVRLSHGNFLPKLLYLLGSSSFPQVAINGKSIGVLPNQNIDVNVVFLTFVSLFVRVPMKFLKSATLVN